MHEPGIRRQDVQLLASKYPELLSTHPHIHRDLEQREKFYLDLIYSLLNKNKELHHQANVNYHAYKQKEAEFTALQLKCKDFLFERPQQLPNCRNVIINFHSGGQSSRQAQREEQKPPTKPPMSKLHIIEEEREHDRKITLPTETKRSVNVEPYSKRSSLSQVQQPPPQPVRIEKQDTITQTEQHPNVMPAKMDASTATQFREVISLYQPGPPSSIVEKVVQFRAVGLAHNPQLFIKLPQQSAVRASSSKQISSMAQTLNKDETSSKNGAASVHSGRKLDYRRYLNELEDINGSNYSAEQPKHPISRSEYLLPQASPPLANLHPVSPRSTGDFQRSSQSEIERLKEDNRNILRRLQTMGF